MLWRIHAPGDEVTEVVGLTHYVLCLFESNRVICHVDGRLRVKTHGCGAGREKVELERESEAAMEALFDRGWIRKMVRHVDVRVFWFELVECARKVLLVGITQLIDQGSYEQLVVGVAIVCVFVFRRFGVLSASTKWGEERER